MNYDEIEATQSDELSDAISEFSDFELTKSLNHNREERDGKGGNDLEQAIAKKEEIYQATNCLQNEAIQICSAGQVMGPQS